MARADRKPATTAVWGEPPPTLALKNFQLLDAQRKQQIFLILRILQAPQTLGICDASPEARERNG